MTLLTVLLVTAGCLQYSCAEGCSILPSYGLPSYGANNEYTKIHTGTLGKTGAASCSGSMRSRVLHSAQLGCGPWVVLDKLPLHRAPKVFLWASVGGMLTAPAWSS